MEAELNKMLEEIYQRLKLLETTPRNGWSRRQYAAIAAQDIVTSTTYVNAPTNSGPSVVAEIGPSGACVVFWSHWSSNAGGNAFSALEIDSGSTQAASDDHAILVNVAGECAMFQLVTSLTLGNHSFNIKYRVGSGVTGDFRRRTLLVIPI